MYTRIGNQLRVETKLDAIYKFCSKSSKELLTKTILLSGHFTTCTCTHIEYMIKPIYIAQDKAIISNSIGYIARQL